MGWRGFNLSMPHKRAVVQLLTDLSPSSRLTGAVNFVSIGSDGSIFGDNTDGEGFARSVESVSPLRGRSVMIFGSGGAARAIAASAGQRGVRAVYVCARDQLDAAAVARLAVESGAGDAQLVMWSDLVVIPAAIDVLVNATSVGMLSRREVIPIDPHSLRPNIVVCDVVISAERTRLVSTAQDCGCVALDGSGMLVQQAALNFQLWTGQTPDVTAMSRVLNVALGSG
jgi:shikimate dehydrogenase